MRKVEEDVKLWNLTCLSEQEWNENAVNLNGLVQICLTIKNNAPMIRVSIDTLIVGAINMNEVVRIEAEPDVKTYLDRLKYAIKNGAEIKFQIIRLVDANRDIKFTNQYTVSTLFPDDSFCRESIIGRSVSVSNCLGGV